MSLSGFKARLLMALSTHLPVARAEVWERRTIVLEVRVLIKEDLFLSVYYNDLTGKTSYTLVHKKERIWGCDNYRFWHYHPYGQPAEHIACEEPEVEAVLAQVREVVEQRKGHDREEEHDSG